MRDDDDTTLDTGNQDVADQTGQWTTNGSGAPYAASPEASDASDTVAADASDEDGTAFLADLARAMQTTAGAEHLRVSEDTERRRQGHLERIRAREASEAEELAATSEADIKGIDAWADGEIDRIQRERERRILARRRDLESSLEDHRILVAREVDAVEAAIVGYRAEVEAFFGRLEAETDPVAIARQAATRPAFPALETVGPDDAPAIVVARAEAASDDEAPHDEQPPSFLAGDAAEDSAAEEEIPVVAVMDTVIGEAPEASEAQEAAPEPVAEVVGAEIRTEVAAGVGPEAEQIQANAVTPRSSAALLQAVPSLRPMAAWFRRDGDHHTHADENGPTG